MGKFIRSFVIFLIFAPIAAMFAEPFFEAVFDILGVNTEDWAVPILNSLAKLFADEKFRYFAFLAIGIGLGISIYSLARKIGLGNSNMAGPAPKRTLLRLQFFGDAKYPKMIESENTHNWFYYRTFGAKIDEFDEGNRHLATTIWPQSWVIGVVFERDLEYQEVMVTFPSSDKVVVNVYATSKRFFFITTDRDLPHEQMEIKTVSRK